jgi:exodeoxyribonuclease-3
MTRIATWNVNSIKARLPHVLEWIRKTEPDVLLLQELKSVEDTFPGDEFTALGYEMAVVGQKSYNGVALLSRAPLEATIRALPGDREDAQARYVEATTFGLRIAGIYLPNGNPIGGEKYAYKLAWMARLARHVEGLLAAEQPFVLGGDYNVIPTAADCYDPEGWRDDALFHIETRRAYRAMVNLGLTDAFRSLHPQAPAYTFWDYQGRAFQGDRGLRIDHLLLSPQAADRLMACEIDREPRGWERASDHTPIWCEIGQ